ncbi:MAG: Fe-Mn family superoxide dismutase [Luteolibacter sp.]
MTPSSSLDRRHFVKLGALAATAAMLPLSSRAAEAGNKGAELTYPYTLPDLPYPANALEPHIDAKTMEIHHGKHHATYIKNLNTALEKEQDLGKKTLGELLTSLDGVKDEALKATLRNNGGGHWNHAFFWNTLAPASAVGKASDELAAAIDRDFGSLDAFKTAFGEAASKRFGSGWAWLIVQGGKLKIVSTANQDNPYMQGLVPSSDLGTPLLGLDVWEHAYYLNYQNRRADYIKAWWNVVNWDVVSQRFAQA